jgi:hypothetical protein
MEKVFDLFSSIYASKAGDGAFLAFEKLGVPITPGMFKLEDGTFSPALAIEKLSEIGNAVLEADGDSVRRSNRTVPAVTELMLTQSMPVTSNADAMAALGKAKNPAAEAFDMTLPSSDPIAARFHPVFANPVNWYDPDANDNWIAHTIGKQEGTPQQPPLGRPSGILLEPRPTWHLVPTDLQPTLSLPLSRSHPLYIALANSEQVTPISKSPAESARFTVRPQVIAMRQSSASLATHEMTAAPASSFMKRVAMTGPASVARSQSFGNIAPATSEVTPAASFMKSAGPLIMAQATAQLSTTTTSQAVSTNSMDMSFEHCVVTLNRPWWPEVFLMIRGWFVPGYASAEFSNGKGNGDPGLLPLLASGFVAIRNLKISTKWSDDDLVAMQKSASFGRFSLVGRTYDSQTGTLSCPGIQIIGWFCEALPILPPASDPAMAAAPADSSSAPADEPVSPQTNPSPSAPGDAPSSGKARP